MCKKSCATTKCWILALVELTSLEDNSMLPEGLLCFRFVRLQAAEKQQSFIKALKKPPSFLVLIDGHFSKKGVSLVME